MHKVLGYYTTCDCAGSQTGSTRYTMRVRSLEEEAQEIFGPQDRGSIGRWVRYWEESRERNEGWLNTFHRLVLLNFKGKRVLDIGCGTGGLGELIGQQCRLYVGGDYHFRVLQFASPERTRTHVQCSATSLPFSDHRFDYIFALDVIEHLTGGASWQIQFLQELRRVLHPLGMIFLTTPNRWYPYEGHSQLYFPHYLPAPLNDRYIARRNPGFLREHGSFSEIKILTPARLRRSLEKSGLVFLHDLPCGLDRREFLSQFPLRGSLAYAGLGWYPHAEFWGMLVRRDRRSALRLKLRKSWYYERNQPSGGELADFGPRIDFSAGPFNQQLGPGWYWYEGSQGRKKGALGYRWTQKEALCYLESRDSARYIRITGYSPWENRMEIWIDGIRVGEHVVLPKSDFLLEYLIPFTDTTGRLLKVGIHCAGVFRSSDPEDSRELGLMIFLVELF